MQCQGDWELSNGSIRGIRACALQYARDTTLYGDDLYLYETYVDWRDTVNDICRTYDRDTLDRVVTYLQQCVPPVPASLTVAAPEDTVPGSDIATTLFTEACSSCLSVYLPVVRDANVGLVVARLLYVRTAFFRLLDIYQQYFKSYWRNRAQNIDIVSQGISQYQWPEKLTQFVCSVVLSPRGPAECVPLMMRALP
jgi:hypothetical protein